MGLIRDQKAENEEPASYCTETQEICPEEMKGEGTGGGELPGACNVEKQRYGEDSAGQNGSSWEPDCHESLHCHVLAGCQVKYLHW